MRVITQGMAGASAAPAIPLPILLPKKNINNMKKVLLMTFVACFAMMFASCQKDLELSGTTWKAHQVINETSTIEGITGTVDMTMDCTLIFADATTGTLSITMSGSVSVMGIPVMTFPADTYSDNFTYTFDGENGVLSATDAESGENVTIPFTYNKKDKTINFSVKQDDVDINFDLSFTQE